MAIHITVDVICDDCGERHSLAWIVPVNHDGELTYSCNIFETLPVHKWKYGGVMLTLCEQCKKESEAE